MNPDDILNSTAHFLKEYFDMEGWAVDETPPSYTLFDIYKKEGEEWAYHVLPINDLCEVDQDFWVPTMKSALSRSIVEKNLAFFGVCQAPQGDLEGFIDPESEYFFLIVYLADRNAFYGKLYDFDMELIGSFDVFQAFPDLLNADFLAEEVIH